MKRIGVFALLSVVFLAGAVSLNAQHRPERGERMMEKLGLSDEQVAQMKDLRADHLKAMADAQASIEKAQIDLRSQMLADEPDKAAITSKMKEIADLRLKQEIARVDHMFQVRSILTPEQRKSFRGMMGEMMGQRDGRSFRRPGRAGMRGGMMHDGPNRMRRQRMHR